MEVSGAKQCCGTKALPLDKSCYRRGKLNNDNPIETASNVAEFAEIFPEETHVSIF